MTLFLKTNPTPVGVVFLIFISLLIYAQTFQFGFISYDDYLYVPNNPTLKQGLNIDVVIFYLTTFFNSNWHPITMYTYVLDYSIYKNNPAGYHVTNVVIHIVNTLLLFLVCKKLSKDVFLSLLISILFSIHPFHVESVAWVAERKGLLSTLFMLAAIYSYVSYLDRNRRIWYIFSLILFVFGLASKATIVIFPFLLLLLDYWPLGRFRERWVYIIVEKIPFFLFSLLVGIITILAQMDSGALKPVENYSYIMRVENAFVNIVTYIIKTVIPTSLQFHYPYPDEISNWKSVPAIVLVVMVSYLVVRYRVKFPWLLVGWFWYLVCLLPVLGFLQTGGHGMADRYTYISLIGIFIIISGALKGLINTKLIDHRIVFSAISSFLLLYALISYQQTRHWETNFTLYNYALEVDPDNYRVHELLAKVFHDLEYFDLSIKHFNIASNLKPKTAKLYFGASNAYYKKNDIDSAIKVLEKAIKLFPNSPEFNYEKGKLLIAKKEYMRAVGALKKALDIDAPQASIYHAMALAYFGMKEYRKSLMHIRRAVKISPANQQYINEMDKISSYVKNKPQ